nr:hypothetical protein Iba_chr06fCG0600 [Ipomoea batatas]
MTWRQNNFLLYTFNIKNLCIFSNTQILASGVKQVIDHLIQYLKIGNPKQKLTSRSLKANYFHSVKEKKNKTN